MHRNEGDKAHRGDVDALDLEIEFRHQNACRAEQSEPQDHDGPRTLDFETNH